MFAVTAFERSVAAVVVTHTFLLVIGSWVIKSDYGWLIQVSDNKHDVGL